jgi:hypothetical protein
MDDDAPDGEEPDHERAGAGGGLAPRRFDPLAPGEVRPAGWLAAQLETQAAGLTGTLPEFWPDLADNRWLGGANDGWERGPYYADGLVPLAFALDDDALRERAERWVEAFLDGADGTGWIGPEEAAGDYEPFDPWPRFVVLKVLRQYADATGDERAVDAVEGFCRYLHAALRNRPLFSWGRFRWADLVVTVDWLYERTGEAWLLDLADLAAEQGYDWTDHFVDFRYPRPQPADEHALETHVVNNAMGVKSPAVRARRAAATTDAGATGTEAVDRGVEALDEFHGQVTGAFSGDEHLAGRSPVRGTELCAVVEYLYSLRYLLSVDGDPAYADRLERLAFNALPATLAPDASAHQYDQQVNQVVCDVTDRGWTNDPDATLFGIAPHYGCCTANLHQGWPKVATGMAMATDDGLAALVHGPYEATVDVGGDDGDGDGERVTVRSRTAYPFADEVTFAFELDGPVAFPFGVRVPSWAVEPTVATPDGEERVEPGTVHVVERTFADGDEVTCTFPAAVEAVRGQRGSVALRRGPLVFSHAPGEQWRRVRGHPPDADYEVHPTTPWRYALAVDPADPGPDVEVSRSTPGDPPFAPDDPPVTLRVPARHCPEWEATETGDAKPPTSPVRTSGEATTLELVPYGCTNLRVTEFPLAADR